MSHFGMLVSWPKGKTESTRKPRTGYTINLITVMKLCTAPVGSPFHVTRDRVRKCTVLKINGEIFYKRNLDILMNQKGFKAKAKKRSKVLNSILLYEREKKLSYLPMCLIHGSSSNIGLKNQRSHMLNAFHYMKPQELRCKQKEGDRRIPN